MIARALVTEALESIQKQKTNLVATFSCFLDDNIIDWLSKIFVLARI